MTTETLITLVLVALVVLGLILQRLLQRRGAQHDAAAFLAAMQALHVSVTPQTVKDEYQIYHDGRRMYVYLTEPTPEGAVPKIRIETGVDNTQEHTFTVDPARGITGALVRILMDVASGGRNRSYSGDAAFDAAFIINSVPKGFGGEVLGGDAILRQKMQTLPRMAVVLLADHIEVFPNPAAEQRTLSREAWADMLAITHRLANRIEAVSGRSG